MKLSKQSIATFLALLFHGCGLIGILFTPYRDWFIRHTALNLGLMGLLLIWTQPVKNARFFLFILTAFLVGMGTEMIGVNTAKLFGHYQYGTLLGPKLNGVPYLIGANWFVVILCAASVMESMHDWFRHKMEAAGSLLPPRLALISLVVDGALLALLFDWIMEPVAMKLGFWQWENQDIPLFNYTCWFLISLFLLLVLKMLRLNKPNHFAVHLFFIQCLFFLTLRTFLVL
ncbi:MAG: carotenoid biosynthesis protein [Bacteroidota bacterium]|nr:carotenoid biosynthesis protein [Bacteroidota bacterium]